MNLAHKELNVIGRWPIDFRANERYNGCAAARTSLRSTIIQKIIAGRLLAGSFCVPETVGGLYGIGEKPSAPATSSPVLDSTASGSPLIPNAKESAQESGARR